MPNYLLAYKDQVLREKYGDYCMKAILSGEEAKPFEEFQCGVRGNHAWLFKEDAEKCCNGFKRVLVIDDLRACDRVVSERLPGGVSYGYKWMPV